MDFASTAELGAAVAEAKAAFPAWRATSLSKRTDIMFRIRNLVEQHRHSALIEQHRYQPLTRQVKERIFGLNAALVFGVDAKAKRNELSLDVLGQLRMSYLEEGPEPSHRVYGWVV